MQSGAAIWLHTYLTAGKAWNDHCCLTIKVLSVTIVRGVIWCGRDTTVPRDKMIRPEDIAQAALLPFRMSALACPTDIVVRPSHKLT